jgi:hypothetical protein
MYSYEQLVAAKCASWKKWYWKFGMLYTKSTILSKKNIKNRILDNMFSAGHTEIKQICYSAIRYGLTLL